MSLKVPGSGSVVGPSTRDRVSVAVQKVVSTLMTVPRTTREGPPKTMPNHRPSPPRELHRRDLEVLKDIILTYLFSAEPVSSRTIARYGATELSAASIRNIMADLEDWGYLAQPHTSAGRVPTTAGYHLFIDTLMGERRLTARERRYIDESLGSLRGDGEDLLKVASHVLSELSQQVGIAVGPLLAQTVLKSIDFVLLAGRKVLCVVVSATGFMDNKLIETDELLSREELIAAASFLTERYAGRTLIEIRDALLQQMAEERARMDRLLGLTLELARKGLEPRPSQEVQVEGTSTVLAHPELSDIRRVRLLVDTFTDKARLVSLLNECIRGDGVRVVIGEESFLTSELDFSLVATTYGSGPGDEGRGTLGIFGPSRMEYPRVIPLVRYLGRALSRALARSVSSDVNEES
jgi:heat-inducible transcriptional repressor